MLSHKRDYNILAPGWLPFVCPFHGQSGRVWSGGRLGTYTGKSGSWINVGTGEYRQSQDSCVCSTSFLC